MSTNRPSPIIPLLSFLCVFRDVCTLFYHDAPEEAEGSRVFADDKDLVLFLCSSFSWDEYSIVLLNNQYIFIYLFIYLF